MRIIKNRGLAWALQVAVVGTTLAFAATPAVAPSPAAADHLTESPAAVRVLSLNWNGAGTNGVYPPEKSKRLADWVSRNKAAPDIVALQELFGWLDAPWNISCGANGSMGADLGDYDQIDQLLFELRRTTGITYRVAYLTGRQFRFKESWAGWCEAYGAQAVLYNPQRLRNETAQSLAGSLPHDSGSGELHLRRSLPLCNRTTNLMPLRDLIDGPLQYDKCGATPSGPAWARFNPNGQGHIIASAVRFTLLAQPETASISLMNIHPTDGMDVSDRPYLQSFISTVEPVSPQDGRNRLYYPPIIAADHNALNQPDDFPLLVRVVNPPIPPGAGWGDPVAIFIGSGDHWNALHRPRVTRSLLAPEVPAGEYCPYMQPEVLISDHCGVFARFEPSPPAPVNLRLDPWTLPGGGIANGTVGLDGPAPAGGLVVNLASNSPAASVPASVTVPASASSAQFQINTTRVSADTPVTISATAQGITKTGVLTVRVPRPTSLGLNPNAVYGSERSTGTVTLEAPAPPGGLTVALSSADTFVAQVPGNVTIPGGASSASFAISTTDVGHDDISYISATVAGVSKGATLTVWTVWEPPPECDPGLPYCE